MIKRKKILKENSGFIVHPFETADGDWDASFGNHNKTSRGFKTFKKAKQYLKRNKIKKAIYDSPSGVKLINLKSKRRVKRR